MLMKALRGLSRAGGGALADSPDRVLSRNPETSIPVSGPPPPGINGWILGHVMNWPRATGWSGVDYMLVRRRANRECQGHVCSSY